MPDHDRHVMWERRQTELWDRIFQVTQDVVTIVESMSTTPGQQVLREELLRSAMKVGAHLVRANASDSAQEFERHVSRARMAAIETDYWLRLMYVLQQKEGVQRDLSSVVTQYSAVILLLERFVRHVGSEPNAVARHTKGPKIS